MKTSVTLEVEEPDVRQRILDAATKLVANGGVAALTTRAVAGAAGVQAPTLYRMFGDKRGLLDAVAEHGLATFMRKKVTTAPDPDPVHDLRNAWDTYVQFGLTHPAVFAIIHEIGRLGPPSTAATIGMNMLQGRIRRIAQAGRLRVPEFRAAWLIHSASTGLVVTQLALPEKERDPALSFVIRDTIFEAILNEANLTVSTEIASLSVALRSNLGTTNMLSPGEAMLLREMLDRIANHSPE